MEDKTKSALQTNLVSCDLVALVGEDQSIAWLLGLS